MIVNITPRSLFGPTRFDRLDAEYVISEDLKHEEMLVSKFSAKPLLKSAEIYNGPTVNKRLHGPATAIRYVDIDSVDLADGLTYPDTLVFQDRPSRAKYVLEKDDILVSNVRPNRGAVTLVTERLAGAIASSGFTLIRPHKSIQDNPIRLYLYLRSASARRQLIRRNRGSMYPAVLSRDVFDILIPDFDEKLIERSAEKVNIAVTLQDQFFSALAEVDAHLSQFLEPIGHPPSPLDSSRGGVPDVTFVSRTYAMQENQRIDAEFFRSEYSEFHSNLRGIGSTFTLGEYYQVFNPHLTRGDVPMPTLKQSALTNAGINWTAVMKQAGRGSGSAVKDGDILLACTAHEIFYVGRKVDLVRDVPEDFVINQAVGELAVIRPRPTKPTSLRSSYVAAFLRQAAGRNQVQRCIRGLRGGHTYPQDLEKHVLIPLPDDDWLEAFEQLASRADRLRAEAKETMVQAVAELDDLLV